MAKPACRFSLFEMENCWDASILSLRVRKRKKDTEVMAQFIKQFYSEAAFIPGQVLLPARWKKSVIIQQWLRNQNKGSAVQLLVPSEGTRQELVEMAAENATETVRALRTQWEADKNKQAQALGELQTAMGWRNPSTARVLRHLQHAGNGGGGQHGGL